ncbi:MAG: hypothetical protein JSV52_03755 [Candidatus Zixiibacteriota bacterium]|nr:MAG: hypothetical protein JSV52_03755 [candidate division Zixibacteria bacterium]
MKFSTRILTLLIAVLFLFGTAVYAGNDNAERTAFVDLNGDGINDNMKDGNGDGIPDRLEADLEAGDDGNTYMNASQSKEQVAEQYQLTFHWRTHEMSKELFQYQYGGTIGDGGQVNQNSSNGSGDTGNKGGK